MNATLVMGVATILGAFDATAFAAALPSLGNRPEILLQWRDSAVRSAAHEGASKDSYVTTVEPSIYSIVFILGVIDAVPPVVVHSICQSTRVSQAIRLGGRCGDGCASISCELPISGLSEVTAQIEFSKPAHIQAAASAQYDTTTRGGRK